MLLSHLHELIGVLQNCEQTDDLRKQNKIQTGSLGRFSWIGPIL